MANTNSGGNDLSAVEYLELKKDALIKKAVDKALDEDNTPILMKLLDKVLPNLSRNENLNANLTISGDLVQDVIVNIGIIEGIDASKMFLADKQEIVTHPARIELPEPVNIGGDNE